MNKTSVYNIAMLIFSLFILQAISASLCFDIQLEGVMTVGKNFLSTLTEYARLGGKLNLRMPKLAFASKGKLPNKAFSEAFMRAAMEPVNNTKNPKPDPLKDYIEHLKKKGVSNIKNIGKEILKDMNSNKNIKEILQTLTDDYVTMLQNYYIFVTEGKSYSKTDKEYIFLDMIETENRLLYGEEKILLNYIIEGLDTTSQNDSLHNMNEKIYRHTVNDKKEEMGYICITYEVCRQYPAFSDYCADLISEILKLPEIKFQLFLEQITTILKFKEDFFTTITEEEDRVYMLGKLETFSGDMLAMKEFLAVMRSVITQRFKLVDSSKEMVKTKTKAVRILIDIIDKALSMDEDIISIDFDTTVQALRAWSGGARQVIGNIFKEFVNHMVRMLDHNLSKVTRKEISVLLEVILRGSTTNTDIYQGLLDFGSDYVKGNDIDAHVESL